jgi:purine-binding chemotaxis protein CheW
MYLVCRVRRVLAGLPLEFVVETMRPLPVAPVADAPDFVTGLSIVRGEPTPVVDAGSLLGFPGEASPSRFVTVRAGERVVALAVEEVLDVRELAAETFTALPPLVADSGVMSAVGALDAELLVALRALRAIPDALWQSDAAEDHR